MTAPQRGKEASLTVRQLALLPVWVVCFGLASPTPGSERASTAESATAVRLKAAAKADPERPAYRVGAGDVLDILVWKEPDFSSTGTVVRGDGKITMPFIKDISVAGFTPAEVEAIIGAKLKEYINEPEVSLVVKQLNSERVYVMGAVFKAGPLSLQTPLTVLQALSAAGGLTEFAKKKKIYILRTVNSQQKRLSFNYDAVLKGQNFEQNVQLLPNDTIVVP